MTDTKSFDHYRRALLAKHQELRNAIDQLVRMLVGPDKAPKLAAGNAAMQKLFQFDSFFDPQVTPPWIKSISNRIEQFTQHDAHIEHGDRLMRTLMTHFHELNNWSLDKHSEQRTSHDLDAIYAEVFSNSRMPQLYDSLIGTLEELIKSDLLESRKVAADLERLIMLLRSNKDGSYFSSFTTMEVILTGARNLLRQVALDTPGLGTFVAAAEKSMDALDIEWGQVQHEVMTKVKSLLGFKQLKIEQKSSGFLPAGTPIEGEVCSPEPDKPIGLPATMPVEHNSPDTTSG